MAIWFLLMTGPPAGAEGGQQGSPLPMLGAFVLIFLIFYMLIIRPQQKKQREHKKMLEQVQTGDRVLTAGGLIGNVMGIKEADGVSILVLKIADNTKVEVSRAHVHQVLVRNRS